MECKRNGSDLEFQLMEPDALAEAMRGEIGSIIQQIVEEEVAAYLGALRYQRRAERIGYRHGHEPRTIVTSAGRAHVRKPRARIVEADGTESEWRSGYLKTYKRRTRDVDAAIVAAYFAGANTRRIKKILEPLIGGGPVSASTVSRLVAKLRQHFHAWRERRLDHLDIVYAYFDAMHVKVRVVARVVKIPLLVGIGVTAEGEKVLLCIESISSENERECHEVLSRLVRQGLARPHLVLVDGGKGLESAIEATWPGVEMQRCLVHKLRNLESKVPQYLREEITADFHAVMYAENEAAARAAYDAMLAKWTGRYEKVAASLREAGERLFTFYRYPRSQWKCLRTTNVVERLIEEFRRRVKTQGSLPNEEAATILFFGLMATGFVKMHKIDGWADMPEVLKKRLKPAA